MKDYGDEITDNQLRDRLLFCIEQSHNYRELVSTITTRIRFSGPVLGAGPHSSHGVTWDTLKSEVRTQDLDHNGGYHNKRIGHNRVTAPSAHLSTPRVDSSMRSDARRYRPAQSRSRSRERSQPRGQSSNASPRNRSNDSRGRSRSPYAVAATRDIRPASANQARRAFSSHRAPSPHPRGKFSKGSRSNVPGKYGPGSYSRSRSPGPSVSFSNPPSSALKKILECYLCGQEHYARYCPLKKQATSNTKANSAVAQGYQLPSDITDDPDHENSTFAAIVLARPSADNFDDLPGLADNNDDDDDFDVEDEQVDNAPVVFTNTFDVSAAFLHAALPVNEREPSMIPIPSFDSNITTVKLVNEYIQHEFEYSMLALANDIALFERIDDKDLMNDLIDAACSALRLVGHRREEVIFRVLDIIQDLRNVSLIEKTDDSEGK